MLPGAIVRRAIQRSPLKRHLRAAGAILRGCGQACLRGGVCLSSGSRPPPGRPRARSQACAPCLARARRQRDAPGALAPLSTPHRGRRCPPDVRARHPPSVLPPLQWWWWVHPAGSLLLVPSQPAHVGGGGGVVWGCGSHCVLLSGVPRAFFFSFFERLSPCMPLCLVLFSLRRVAVVWGLDDGRAGWRSQPVA